MNERELNELNAPLQHLSDQLASIRSAQSFSIVSVTCVDKQTCKPRLNLI